MAVIPEVFETKCKEALFPKFKDATLAFVLYARDHSSAQVVEVTSYKSLLLEAVELADEGDLEHYQSFTEEQSRKFLREVCLTAQETEGFPFIPIQITPSSYVLLLVTGKLSAGKNQDKQIAKEMQQLAKKFGLSKEGHKRMEAYLAPRKASEKLKLLGELAQMKKSKIEELFEEEGLEELEEELITAPPWSEAWQKFTTVWTREPDAEIRKNVYRDLGYKKDPKKAPEQNKEALVRIFTKKYESLSLEKRRDFVEYLEQKKASTSRALKYLIGEKRG